MKKWLVPLLPALWLLMSGCTGLPAAREMGDMALLRTMGVDVSPAGVAITGSTGLRAKGIQGEGQGALILEADRESLSAACLAIQGQSDSYVFFGYVEQLLVGQGLAERGVRPVLDYFARDAQLGLGAQMWLVRADTARQALAAGGDQGVESRLETIRNDSKMGIAQFTRTAGEVYTDLLELGCGYIPALAPDGEGGAVLAERGYAILRGESLAGYLDGEAARGLEMLAGGAQTDILQAEVAGNRVSVKMTMAHTRSHLEFQGGSPSSLKLACKVEGRLAEYERRLSDPERQELKEMLERQEQARLEEAMKWLQAWGTDCAGLGAKAAVGRPIQWQRIRESWPEWFSQVPVEIRVEVNI